MSSDNRVHAQIPVIDLSEHNEQVANSLIASVVEWGFVYVRGDVGFTTRIVDEMFDIVSFIRGLY